MTRPALLRAPRRLPLPLTSLAIALLVLLPALQILRWPRPRAQGLEQLMAASSLLQSFQATPERRLPELWRDRLGAELGARLWRLQRRSWWQFWGPHADGQPYLALPDPGPSLLALSHGRPAARQQLQERALRVGDLLVLAPDPLSRQLLKDRLRPRLRPSRGLPRECLELLEAGQLQAVFWNPTGVGALLGPLAPLFQRYQEGCLSLQLADGARLRWQGQAMALQGLTQRPPRWGEPPAELPALPAGLLLELGGNSLQPLLQGLIQRELIREPLTTRYGLDANRLERLNRAPFLLGLRPLDQGRFQAAVELHLRLEGGRAVWQPVLDRISTSLREQGLRSPAGVPGRPSSDRSAAAATGATPSAGEADATAAAAPGAPARQDVSAAMQPQPAAPEPASRQQRDTASPLPADPGLTLWTAENGEVLGGWRWLPAHPSQTRLLLFLGPPPLLLPAPWPTLPRTGGLQRLQLRLRPAALAERGLLPPLLPQLVQQASQLQFQAQSLPGSGPDAPFSQLTGQLQVERQR